MKVILQPSEQNAASETIIEDPIEISNHLKEWAFKTIGNSQTIHLPLQIEVLNNNFHPLMITANEIINALSRITNGKTHGGDLIKHSIYDSLGENGLNYSKALSLARLFDLWINIKQSIPEHCATASSFSKPKTI